LETIYRPMARTEKPRRLTDAEWTTVLAGGADGEVWKGGIDVDGSSLGYGVSTDGRIDVAGHVFRGSEHSQGYFTKSPHSNLGRIFLATFDRLPNNGEVADHLSHLRIDNSILNLVWKTPRQNSKGTIRHSRENGRAWSEDEAWKRLQQLLPNKDIQVLKELVALMKSTGRGPDHIAWHACLLSNWRNNPPPPLRQALYFGLLYFQKTSGLSTGCFRTAITPNKNRRPTRR